MNKEENGSVEHSVYDDTHERIHAYQFCIQSKSFSTVQLSIPVGLDIFKDPAFVLRFCDTFSSI